MRVTDQVPGTLGAGQTSRSRAIKSWGRCRRQMTQREARLIARSDGFDSTREGRGGLALGVVFGSSNFSYSVSNRDLIPECNLWYGNTRARKHTVDSDFWY
jgi:hypothetical protein